MHNGRRDKLFADRDACTSIPLRVSTQLTNTPWSLTPPRAEDRKASHPRSVHLFQTEDPKTDDPALDSDPVPVPAEDDPTPGPGPGLGLILKSSSKPFLIRLLLPLRCNVDACGLAARSPVSPTGSPGAGRSGDSSVGDARRL